MTNTNIQQIIEKIFQLETQIEDNYNIEQIQSFFNYHHYDVFILIYEPKTILKINQNHLWDIINNTKDILLSFDVIGYALFFKNDSEKLLELHKIVIDSNLRGHGLAFDFLNQIFNYYKKQNYRKIFLEVSEQNLPAINLYKKLNFKIIQVRKKYYQNNTDAFVMTLDFNSL